MADTTRSDVLAERFKETVIAEVKTRHQSVSRSVVDVDVGVNEYVTADEMEYPTSRSYRKSERQLCRAQQALARNTKGSKNRAKTKSKVAIIHARTANILRDWLHKMTTDLAKSYSLIATEDLNVNGMGDEPPPDKVHQRRLLC